MNLQEYKTVVIMLDVDMGCNHLSNLVATSPKLADRVEDPSVNYIDRLIGYYEKKIGNAHASPIVSDIDEITKPTFRGIVERSPLPFVIGGHLQSLYGKSGDAIKEIGKTLVLLGVADKVNEAISYRADQQFVDYFLENYKKDKVAQYTNIPETDIIEFDPNLLFSPDISELMNQFNNKIGLDLDLAICQRLHTTWFNTILRIIERRKNK
jgi:hypothetical protein